MDDPNDIVEAELASAWEDFVTLNCTELAREYAESINKPHLAPGFVNNPDDEGFRDYCRKQFNESISKY